MTAFARREPAVSGEAMPASWIASRTLMRLARTIGHAMARSAIASVAPDLAQALPSATSQLATSMLSVSA